MTDHLDSLRSVKPWWREYVRDRRFMDGEISPPLHQHIQAAINAGWDRLGRQMANLHVHPTDNGAILWNADEDGTAN